MLTELPPKTEITQSIEPSPEEKELLQAERLRKLAVSGPETHGPEGDFKSTFPKDQLEQLAAGDVDKDLMGISPVVVSIMNDAALDDGARAASLKMHASNGLLSEQDKRWVRGKTTDAEIRKAVA